MRSYCKRWPMKPSFHIIFLLGLELVFIILFAVFGRFNSVMSSENFAANFPLFTDVHAMIYVGIGFILTFLRNYGLSAVTLNLLIASLSLQWYIIVSAVLVYLSGTEHTFVILFDLKALLYGDFAAATVLISFCVLLGKLTILQLAIMTLIEVVLFVTNEYVGRSLLKGFDVGDTIFLHLFAAYFGLSVSRTLYVKMDLPDSKFETTTESNLFSLLGTLVLFIYWPSFNASGSIPGAPQERASVNTYLSLTAAVLGSMCVSGLLNSGGKIQIEHVQNAVLAGGVAIGTIADLNVWPYLSILIGVTAGALSTMGFVFTPNFFLQKLKIHDSCGVHSLHGIPSLLGALVSIIIPPFIQQEHLGDEYSALQPAVGGQRGRGAQSLAQVEIILATLATSVVGGLLTGALLNLVGRLQLDGQPILHSEDVLEDRYNIYVESDSIKEKNVLESTRGEGMQSLELWNESIQPMMLDLLYPSPEEDQQARPRVLSQEATG